MAIYNFSPENTVVTVNTREITDWGETAMPYTDDPIDPTAALRRGQGGNAVRLNRINPGRTVNLYLNPGSPDSGYINGLMNSNATITLTETVIGSGEVAAGSEGVIVKDGSKGRAGSTITDDQYIIEFNIWDSTKGSL